ncbi:hypothetical protein A8F94_01310 [Bacillus sp. FJAT-27225]|uniref:hypothetical protein n=1 Tax=Bacillus sp. FJAT-27225 TaxID=1743144 RepID=UPI00080C21ED|nr:hypothetical protein [Bacillus sp. FJAT-27225]OCA90550.1 hypothetical protein A8F94_01310 [Bacillus sp. FJAT-27225]
MKKYILPAIILVISILFLNNVTELPEKEEEISSDSVPTISSAFSARYGGKELILLEKTGVDPSHISKQKLAKAMEKAETFPVSPWERLLISHRILPSKVTFTEYDPDEGIFGTVHEGDLYQAPAAPGVKGLIITVEWEIGGKSTYFAKIDVQKVYSYQEMISPNPETFTVLAFSEKDTVLDIPESKDETYIVQTVHGNRDELKRKFPELRLSELPAFFVFQTNNMIMQTVEVDQLISFVTKNERYVYEGETENWMITLTAEQKIGNGTFKTLLTYKGKNGDQIGQIGTTVNGESWSLEEGGHQLDGNNQSIAGNMITWPITEEEKVTYIVRWDGQEETIPLILKGTSSTSKNH